MSTIVLKTARRHTKVSRIKVRRAVAAIYSAGVTPTAKNVPAITLTKKASVKKTSVLK